MNRKRIIVDESENEDQNHNGWNETTDVFIRGFLWGVSLAATLAILTGCFG